MYGRILLTNMEFEALLQECTSVYGPMNLDYLVRSVEFTAQVLAETPRVFAIRCDLRFAVDTTEYDPDHLSSCSALTQRLSHASWNPLKARSKQTINVTTDEGSLVYLLTSGAGKRTHQHTTITTLCYSSIETITPIWVTI